MAQITSRGRSPREVIFAMKYLGVKVIPPARMSGCNDFILWQKFSEIFTKSDTKSEGELFFLRNMSCWVSNERAWFTDCKYNIYFKIQQLWFSKQ